MSQIETDWSKNELQAYILLYCAHADFDTSPEETEIIRSKVNSLDYKKICAEFEDDNDYQSIQKIQSTITRLHLSETQIDSIVAEIKELFESDGDFAAAERALFMGLKHILQE